MCAHTHMRHATILYWSWVRTQTVHTPTHPPTHPSIHARHATLSHTHTCHPRPVLGFIFGRVGMTIQFIAAITFVSGIAVMAKREGGCYEACPDSAVSTTKHAHEHPHATHDAPAAHALTPRTRTRHARAHAAHAAHADLGNRRI